MGLMQSQTYSRFVQLTPHQLGYDCFRTIRLQTHNGYVPDRRFAQSSDQTKAQALSALLLFDRNCPVASITIPGFVARCVQPCARVGIEIAVMGVWVA